jgi:hypothetical protein
MHLVITEDPYGWDRSQINDIMMTCIILHNMIVEDEQDDVNNTDFLTSENWLFRTITITIQTGRHLSLHTIGFMTKTHTFNYKMISSSTTG